LFRLRLEGPSDWRPRSHWKSSLVVALLAVWLETFRQLRQLSSRRPIAAGQGAPAAPQVQACVLPQGWFRWTSPKAAEVGVMAVAAVGVAEPGPWWGR
jgi:hypothetical protein